MTNEACISIMGHTGVSCVQELNGECFNCPRNLKRGHAQHGGESVGRSVNEKGQIQLYESIGVCPGFQNQVN